MEVALEGRAAIVTGAASGIGLAIAQDLAAHGARVMLADLNQDAGERAASQLPGAAFQHTDVARRDDCRRLVETTRERFGSVDILVNNAGYQYVAPVQEFPEDRWDNMLAVMLSGPFLLIRYAAPYMYARRWGRIVNVSSLHGVVASPFKAAYVSAKHGVIGLTRTVALEAAEHGVTVNAICPTYVRTPLVEKQIADQARTHGISEAEVVERIMLAPAAIKRLLEPSEVARFVTFLCSEAGAGFTGAALLQDCGWTAR